MDFDGPIADSMEALASRLRKAGRVLIDENAALRAENARLQEDVEPTAPTRLRVDVQASDPLLITQVLSACENAVAVRKVREWCAAAEANEDFVLPVAEVRALLPPEVWW